MDLSLNKNPGLWKLNCSVLNETNYVDSYKSVIKEAADETLNFTARDRWDFIKFKIKSFSMKYSADRKKEKEKAYKQAENSFRVAEILYNQNPNSDTASNLKMKQDVLEKLIEEKTEGAIVRSRCRWYEHGEKSSKYFCI